MKRFLWSLVVLLLALPAAIGQTPPPSSASFEETTLRQAGVGPDAASLFKLLNDLTRNDGDATKINRLIVKLGSLIFEERERASNDLVAIGRPALLPLRQARKKDDDPEVRLRAAYCIEAIENSLDANTAYAAVRLLIHRRVEGAAQPLLAYLPDADWEIQGEILRGLHHVAKRDGKLDPALLTALGDKTPQRRAAAALAVALVGNKEERAQVHKLLADAEPLVRLRAAQGLLAANDAASLPVLIALLNEPSVDISWSAEELLHWVAADKAPAQKVGAASPAERKKAVDAWTEWHKRSAAAIDWKLLEEAPRRPGLYFICEESRVWLCGCDGKQRWTLPGSYGAHDIVLLPGNQVVVAPYNGEGYLAKRDLRGKVLWKYVDRNMPDDFVVCQRLANGNFFLATEEGMSEISADGRPVAQAAVEDINPGDAWKMRNGRILCRHDAGLAEMAGMTGHVLREIPLEKARFTLTNKFAVLPDGRCILADYRQNRLIELDQIGKPARTIPVRGAWSVEALRNGNYLVSTHRDPRLVEIDPQGRAQWEVVTKQRPLRVRAVLDEVRIGFDKPRPADFNIDSAAYRLRSLKDADPLVRQRSATFLTHLAPTDEASIAGLIAALDDSSSAVRTQVAAALTQIGPNAVTPLIQTLRIGTASSRGGAATALKGMGPAAKKAVPELIELIKNAKMEREVRHAAADTLGSIGRDANAAVPVLLGLLKGDADSLRSHVCLALPAIGPNDPAVVAGLIDALKDEKHPEGRQSSLHALAMLGPKAKAAVADLLALMRSPKESPTQRQLAVDALGSVGAEASAAVAPLLDLLKDTQQPQALRGAVARNLGRFGPEAKSALPVFTEFLTDPKTPQDLTVAVTKGLAAMGKDGVPTLAVAVNKGNALTRKTAINQLTQMGDEAKLAIPALTEASRDKDRTIAMQANRAIRTIQMGAARRQQMLEMQKLQLELENEGLPGLPEK